MSDLPPQPTERCSHEDRLSSTALLTRRYDEFRALAGSYFTGQPADGSLQPTALVHEAFVKIVEYERTNKSGTLGTSVQWESEGHLFAVIAKAMRQILVDRARARNTAKRGGRYRVGLDDVTPVSDDPPPLDVLALDVALQQLDGIDERAASVVELRFFGRLTVDEVAGVLGISKTTAENEWRWARAWLKRELRDTDDDR